MRRLLSTLPAAVLAMVCAQVPLHAQQNPAQDTALSKTQQLIQRAGAENKFTFVLFYSDSLSARAVANVAKAGIAKRQDRAVLASVQVADPAEQHIVSHFGAARAPLPLVIALAPNGAVTGIFAQKLTDANLDDAIVTPTMTKCMKSLQEGKLVFVCLQTSDQAVVSNAIEEFQTDPLFKDRLSLISMQLNDPAEARFLTQMQVDARRTPAATTVLLAPPGVLIGKYGPSATKDEVAAALHKAGKCCDDENCKHNQPQGTAPQPSAGSPRPATGRN